jgi:hypothetical protein
MGLLGKKYSPGFPDLTMQQVWTEFVHNSSPTRHRLHPIAYEHLHKFGKEAQTGILQELLKIEAIAAKESNSLLYLRKKIADLVDRKTSAKMLLKMNSMHQEPAEFKHEQALSFNSIELILSDCEVQIAILREYTKGKYGDANKNDWFELYSCISEYFHHNMAQCKPKQQDETFSFDGQLLEKTEGNFKKCREKCINAFVGQQFLIKPEDSNWINKFISAIKRQDLWK